MTSSLPIAKTLKIAAAACIFAAAAFAIYMGAKNQASTSPAQIEPASGAPVDPSKDPAITAGFAPHKALYDISLVSTKSGSQIINITGQMFYEWRPSCDGWISNHRFNLVYEYADTPAMRVSSDFSNFETFDGSRLDFTSQRKREGNVFEEIRGHALGSVPAATKASTSTTNGTPGQALYSLPKGLVFDLPKGSMFPVKHSLEVKKAIDEGKRFFSATIFDGSDEEGPVEINAFLSKKPMNLPKTVLNVEKIDQDLLKSPIHDVRLAFFPLNNPSSSADYEMQMLFHDNSVISDMIVEYEDFTVRQSLVALEKIEGGCEINNDN